MKIRQNLRNRQSRIGSRPRFLKRLLLLATSCLLVLVTGGAHAAITFRGAEQNAIATVSSITHVGAGSAAARNGCGDINPSIPAGSNGDLLIATVVTKEVDGGNTVSMSGWNSYYSASNGSGGDNNELQVYIFWRVATGGDPNTISQSGSFCNGFGGQIARFSGVDTADPFETATPGVVFQDSNNLDTGTITTTSASAMLLVAGFMSNDRNLNPGAGWSESYDFVFNDSGAEPDFGLSLSYQAQTTAGNKSVSNWDYDGGGSDENYGIILGLTPASSSAGLTINVPAGTTADDVMVAAIAVRPSSITISAPAGWTSLNRVNQTAGNSNAQEIFYRVATAGEPASYTWTFSGSIGGAAGGIITYEGVDTANPVDVFGGNTTPFGTSHTANSVTTTAADAMLVSTHSFSSSETWTPPGGMTERVDAASLATPNAGGIALEMNDELLGAAGVTGNRTATVGGNADTGAAHLLALTPAVPVPEAEYRMDESAWDGTTDEVQDESGNGFHGRSQNGANTNGVDPAIAGDPGTCRYGDFDGSDDYVEISNLSTILNDTASLAFWIKTTQTGNDTGWMAPGVAGVEEAGGSDDIFWGWLDASGRIGISVGNDFSSKSSVPINDGNWRHVVLTRDASDGSYKIYIDGNLDTSGTIGAGVIGNGYSSIGRIEDTGGSPEYLDGSLDEVRIYDQILDDADVITVRDSTHPCPSVGARMEVATVTLNDTTATPAFTSVTFNQTYTTAPLVFVLPTNEGSESASVRIRNVTTTGFEISQVEPDNQDGVHLSMTVDYLAIEEGTLTLPDGTVLEAGTISTTTLQHGSGVAGGEGWETVNFNNSFAGTPAVLAQVQTMSNESGNPPSTTSVPWLVAAVRNIATNDMELALERAEVATGSVSANETIGYLAVEGNIQGSFATGSLNILYETIVSADNIRGWDNENCASNGGQAIPFVNSYAATPLAVAHQNTHDGGDGGWVRRCNISTSQINLAVDEDTFRDSERNHTTERAGVLVFSEAFCIPSCEGPAVDHYAISYPNGSIGITCEPSTVLITAHDSSDNPVSVPGGTTLVISSVIDGTATLSGEWDNATGGGSLSGNPGNPVTYTWPASPEESSVTLELRQLAAATLDVNLDDGTAQELEGPTIEFRDAVFRIVDSSASPVAVTTKLSGKESATAGTGFQSLFLQAIETNDSLECQTVFENQSDVTVELASECNNPAACEGVSVEVENDTGTMVPIASNANASVGSYTGVQFDFDADSKTPLNFRYADAGRIILHARFDLDPPNNVYMQGDSGPFVVRPAGICVESTDAGSDCASGDGNCGAFIKAGNTFNLTVRAVTWENDAETDSDFCTGTNSTTPNFELNSIALAQGLVAPAGGDAGTLGITSADIVDADQGTVTLSAQTISEVGVFNVTATPPVYLGETIAAAGSANIGRFYPDRFVVIGNGSPAFADECSTGTPFTYLDQTFRYGSPPALTLRALNVNGNQTLNYGQDFWKLAVTTLDRSYVDNAGVSAVFSEVQDNTITVTGDTDLDGEGTLTLDAGTDGDAFMYSRVAEEGEFTADVDVSFTGFSGSVANTDDLTDSDSVCHDADDDGACDDYTISSITGATLRFGRLVIGTAFGSELLPLRPEFRTQYFDGATGSFITNTDDGCTTIAATDLSLTSAVEGPETDGDVVITAGGSCPGPGNGCTTATVTNMPFVSGDGLLEFSAPGAGNTGQADIMIDLSAIPLAPHPNMNWLRYDWDDTDGAGDGPYDDNPGGRITFGIYLGPDDFIYFREPW